MRQDDYGAALEQTLRQSDHPMSAVDLRDAVGCSRQRVYVWLQANAPHLREVGKGSTGGAQYEWVEPMTDVRARRETRVDDDTAMHVTSFFVDDGQVVLVVRGPDGSTYHARPAPAQ
jgi:hypothetical protein